MGRTINLFPISDAEADRIKGQVAEGRRAPEIVGQLRDRRTGAACRTDRFASFQWDGRRGRRGAGHGSRSRFPSSGGPRPLISNSVRSRKPLTEVRAFDARRPALQGPVSSAWESLPFADGVPAPHHDPERTRCRDGAGTSFGVNYGKEDYGLREASGSGRKRQPIAADRTSPRSARLGTSWSSARRSTPERPRWRRDRRFPVVITAYQDRSFTFELKLSPVSFLLKKAAGIKSGSKTPGRGTVGPRHARASARNRSA